jgi:hypothetical protein
VIYPGHSPAIETLTGLVIQRTPPPCDTILWHMVHLLKRATKGNEIRTRARGARLGLKRTMVHRRRYIVLILLWSRSDGRKNVIKKLDSGHARVARVQSSISNDNRHAQRIIEISLVHRTRTDCRDWKLRRHTISAFTNRSTRKTGKNASIDPSCPSVVPSGFESKMRSFIELLFRFNMNH